MLISKYICDRCGKEMEVFGAYTIEIKPMQHQGYANCQPINTVAKHMCSECIKTIFDNS